MQDNAITLRPATETDLAAINDIYNHYVLHSTCTYQEEPEPLAGQRQWFKHHGKRHPVIRSSKVPARLSPPAVPPCGDAVSPEEIQKIRTQTRGGGF